MIRRTLLASTATSSRPPTTTSFATSYARSAALSIAALGLLAGCSKTTEKPAEQPPVVAEAPAAPAPAVTAPAPAGEVFSMPKDLKTTPSGLQYQVDLEGSGAQPKAGQTVLVHYTGWLTNGTRFDTSRERGQPISFTLGQHEVIPGWDEGIAMMKVGGKQWLVIPPKLGYGESGQDPVIPPSATLVFHVELVGVQ